MSVRKRVAAEGPACPKREPEAVRTRGVSEQVGGASEAPAAEGRAVPETPASLGPVRPLRARVGGVRAALGSTIRRTANVRKEINLI